MMEKNAKLALSRELPLSRAEAWAWLSDNGRLAKWYGTWRLEGDRLFIRLLQEEDQPEMEGRLTAYVDERMLQVKMGTDDAAWVVRVGLEDAGAGTLLTLSQDLTGGPDDPWLEAGWNFYLDCLVAATQNKALPKFADYAPQPQEGGQAAT